MTTNKTRVSKIRVLPIVPLNDGLLSGIMNGLNATDFLFDVPKIAVSRFMQSSLESDVKALRSDVRKAKAKLTRQAANAAG
jgi:hypothetical protein